MAAVQVPMLFESRQAEISLLTGVSYAFNPTTPRPGLLTAWASHGLGLSGPIIP